jgi:hypothetical protein
VPKAKLTYTVDAEVFRTVARIANRYMQEHGGLHWHEMQRIARAYRLAFPNSAHESEAAEPKRQERAGPAATTRTGPGSTHGAASSGGLT